MADIKIRVGASVDSNIGSAIFKPIVEQAKRAKKEVDQVFSKGPGGEHGGGYRDADQSAKKRAVDAERERAARQDIVRLAKDALKADKDAAREREKKARDAEREAQAMMRRNQRIADSAALRVSGGAVRGFQNTVRQGVGVANDLARGAGLDFSLGGALQKRQSLEAAAVALSNAGFMPGDKTGANNKRIDPRALMAEAQKVGIDTATDAGDALAGLSEFVGKTGDLATGRAIMGDIAKLSKATGTNLKDMVAAAGDVSSGLGDIEGKGPTIVGIMTTFAAQGKEGAVEIRHLSTQMAKLAAGAGGFGGDRGKAFGELGALAQMARQRGGAVSAQGAATALSSFVATFDKGAREKAFKAEGVTTRNKDGSLRSAEDIIVESLNKTGGDSMRMGKMFADVQARRATKGWEAIYREAEAKEKGSGEREVRKRFKALRDARVDESELAGSFNAAMGTGASQAQILKNKIEKDLGDALEKAAPKLMQLGEIAGKMLVSFGGLVSWAADNPIKAAMAAFTMSVTKSMAAEIMRASTERMFGRMAGGVAVAGASGGFMGPLGGSSTGQTAMNIAGAAMTITATAVTLYSAGTAFIDKSTNTTDQANNLANMGNETEQKIGDYNEAKRASDWYRQTMGEANPELVKKADDAFTALQQQRAKVRRQVAGGEAYVETVGDPSKLGQDNAEGYQAMAKDMAVKLGAAIGGLFGGAGVDGVKQQQEAAGHLGEMKADIARMNQILSGQTLKVEVTNQPGGGAPGVPPGGRQKG